MTKLAKASKITVADYYQAIHKIAPFNTGDSYDNIGLLVGDMNDKVVGVVICLDVTNAVIDEAIKKKANLIIAHHPVIFHPLKTLKPHLPPYRLAQNNINMIAAHTNFDVADYGTSDIMAELLGYAVSEILNKCYPELNKGYGRICNLDFGITGKSLAEQAKKAFFCKKVKLYDSGKEINRVALCSGGSGGELQNAINAGCDALIGGDIKHDVWIDAMNEGITLVDAGHFCTENIFCPYLAGILANQYHNIPVCVADNSKEPFKYI